MATPQSTPAPTGGDITSENFNNLRKDTVDSSAGHDHVSNFGKQVDHVNLASKGTNTHVQVDTHIAAVSAVHGHAAGVYDLGIVAGTKMKMVVGSADIVFTGPASGGEFTSTLANWGTTFAVSPPFCFVSAHQGGTYLHLNWLGFDVASATQYKIRASLAQSIITSQTVTFNWIVIGQES